ncbi:MAG TPA: hypothetical protein ENH29_04080 [Bacteroidetes bacterium]|nr:hypothetical protein [Bacteroidota bacterium]
MPENLIWFVWSLGLILVWFVVFMLSPKNRRRMVTASLITMPFGLTEPIFVPEYWNPPSLFNLAKTTGFDIESLVFCFGIGGLGIIFYDVIFNIQHEKMSSGEKHHKHHRFHIWTLLSPIIIFPLLYFSTGWNPIYTATVSMFVAALAALWCRPDLKIKIWVSGFIFLIFYFLYFLPLNLFFSGYVENVWTLANISGVFVFGIPVEELIFAFTFGMLWSSYYEHITWRKIVP